ncbi:MAG: ATP-binding protein [Oscillibacter sp.]|nr:ATP-binding protein [Oscillibacter sp.]
METENQRLAMQTAQYESLKGRMEETRQARHDLRQHLRLMQAYVDTGNVSALQEYLKAYGQSLPVDTGIRYCENTVADTVVRYYAEQAQAQGVSFSAKLALPEALPLPEPDLCVLLGNLLENALESCKKHLDDSPYIRMGGKLVGAQMLTIIVDNCPADEPKRERERLLSSKRPSAGTGTASVRAIAERYGGEARFSWKDKVFSAEVVLTLPESHLK